MFSLVEQKIYLRDDISEKQMIKTLLHELAHSELHNDITIQKTKNEKEIEAESIAFVVSEHLGIDTSDYSFKYVAIWGKDSNMDALKSSLKIIQEKSNELIERIDKKVLELDKVLEAEVVIPKKKRSIEMERQYMNLSVEDLAMLENIFTIAKINNKNDILNILNNLELVEINENKVIIEKLIKKVKAIEEGKLFLLVENFIK